MSDVDRVFARLGGGHLAASEQRELRSVPRRGGAAGSRAVEVVRLPARGPAAGQDPSRRPASKVRAQTWDDGFPARSKPLPSPAPPVEAEPTAPVAHVMPMWEPSTDEAATARPAPAPADDDPSAAEIGQPVRRSSGGKARQPTRRVADPFDADDDRANCLSCGYVIQPARERRGLMTCSECG